MSEIFVSDLQEAFRKAVSRSITPEMQMLAERAARCRDEPLSAAALEWWAKRLADDVKDAKD